MLTTKELAEYLKVHENTIYNLTKKGMPYFRIGNDFKFKIEEVEGWLRNNQKRSN